MKQVLPIPFELELHGITYRVKMQDDLSVRNDSLGEASYRLNEIVIQSNISGTPMTEDRQGQVFLHELTHHILRQMGEKIKDEEKFVELFSSLLHQAMVTAKYVERTPHG